MFPSPTSTLTIGKVISGISKTLGIASQVIPIYKEAKPMIQNAKTIINTFKEFNKKSSPTSSIKPIIKPTPPKVIPKATNNPQFFL